MGISRLLTLAVLLASVSSSPIIPETPISPSFHATDHAVNAATGDNSDSGTAKSLEESTTPLINTVTNSQLMHRSGLSVTSHHDSDPASSISLHDANQQAPKEITPPLGVESPDAVTLPAIRDRSRQERSQSQISRADSCVYTISEAPVASPCSWNGVMTVYPSTTTAFKHVDCNGCEEVYIHRERYNCPIHGVANATQQLNYASTLWSTICLPSATSMPHATPSTAELRSTGDMNNPIPVATPTPSRPKPGSGETRPFTTHMPIPTSLMHPSKTPSPTTMQMPRPPQAIDSQAPQDLALNPRLPKVFGTSGQLCPTTYIIQPPKTAGAIWTHFLQTLTTTACIPCAGCPLVTSTALMGYGPAGRFKTTVTAPMGTTTVYKCA